MLNKKQSDIKFFIYLGGTVHANPDTRNLICTGIRYTHGCNFMFGSYLLILHNPLGQSKGLNLQHTALGEYWKLLKAFLLM